MARTLSACALLAILPCAARADDAPAETVVRLTVTPQAAPKPALRYQLLPELREMSPGNPIQGYLTCFMEQNHFFYDKQQVEEQEKWRAAPLKELPDLRGYGGGALRQADYAARLDAPDWQILLRMRRDGYNTLLPDVQVMRRLAAALMVRFRGELARRRFDDALTTAKTMFALSRHLGDHPSVIGDLVGVAVALEACGPLEEMIQQPGSPNLYWALTDLPSPFIDLRRGRQGERQMAEIELHMLDNRGPMTDAQIDQALEKIRTMLDQSRGADAAAVKNPAAWVAARAADEGKVGAARRRLIESGLDEDGVKRLPPRQVILLDEKLTFEVQSEEASARMALPLWETEKLPAAPEPKPGETLFAWMGPAYANVRRATARLDQRLALLRTVEALRAHAAEHDGRLPAVLSDVNLPLPVEPVTGKPFAYKLDGGTATLSGAAPAGREKDAAYNVRYEITVAK